VVDVIMDYYGLHGLYFKLLCVVWTIIMDCMDYYRLYGL